MAELIDEFFSLSHSSSKTVDVCPEMLDYAFVERCNNTDELRSILSSLTCGHYGRYPHLEETVRNKLVSLLPEKEKKKLAVMRTKLSVEDVNNVKTNLGDWLKSLEDNGSKNGTKSLIKISHPIRNTTYVKSTAPTTNDESDTPDENTKTERRSIRKEKMSTKEYFETWAKFSDEESEDSENEAISNSAIFKTTEDDTQASRRQRNLEMLELRNIIENNELEQAERQCMSTREREKGNEYFKCGENEKAWHCYSKSVLLDPSNAKSFANRAAVLARLGRREDAIQDCNKAINIDPVYTKALARRGMIFHQMERFEEAIHDFDLCATLDVDGGYTRLRGKSEAKLREQLEKKKPEQQTELKIDGVDSFDQSDDIVEEVYTPGILQAKQDGCNPDVSCQQHCSIARKPACGNKSDVNVSKKDGSKSRQRVETSDRDEEINTVDPEGHLMRRVEIVVEESDDEEEFDGVESTGSKRPSVQDESERCKEEGNAAMSANQFNEAISHYSKALDLDPTKTSALNNRSLAYIKTTQFEKAITDATNCLALEPSNIKAMYRRGLATMMCSESASAAECAMSDFKAALSLNPPKDKQVILTKKLKECEMLLKSMVHTGSCEPKVQNTSVPKSPSNAKKRSHDTTALCF